MLVNANYMPVVLPKGVKIISNSETDSMLTCERKHLFYFIFDREPKHPGRSLSIGIAGHEILAVYYTAIAQDYSKAVAVEKAFQLLSKMYVEQTYDPEHLQVVHALLSRYFEQDRIPDSCEILAVEEDFYMPINELYWYGMRLDLLLKVNKGHQAGNVVLVDHKFTYDFKTPAMLKLNPQMPKYVPTIRYSGIPVADAYLNQLRTRFKGHLIADKGNVDLFQKASTDITPERCESAIKQQMILSERIIERRSQPLELQLEEAVPVRNDMVCRNCPFQDPCQMLDNGIKIEGTMNTMYKKRTYGYLKDEGNNG